MSDDPASACVIDRCEAPAVGSAELAYPNAGPDRGRFIRGNLPMCERHGSAHEQGRPLNIEGVTGPDGTIAVRVTMPGMAELLQWWDSLSSSTREQLCSNPQAPLSRDVVDGLRRHGVMVAGAFWTSVSPGAEYHLPDDVAEFVEARCQENAQQGP